LSGHFATPSIRIKFNKVLLANLRRKHPDKEDYKKDFTADDIADWVDHSPDNLWVLCDVHHATNISASMPSPIQFGAHRTC